MIEEQVKILLDKTIHYLSDYEQLVIVERNYGCVDGKIIGTGRSDYTQNAAMYDLSIEEKTFSLIDIPGIEGDESKFEDVIRESLEKAHTIFFVSGSGKKIEQATLEKIKKYMRDGVSVYAVFNVHCKAKKERVPGIDKTFEEELNAAYMKQKEIISQTERELNSFLGNNYKGSLSLNGLLAFCGYAMDPLGKTTIVDEKDKNLRLDQRKYIKEYSGEIKKLRTDSQLYLVQDVINEKVSNFEEYIYSENIKKLKNRLREMIDRIDTFKGDEIGKIELFIKLYNEFESNCYNAKEDFIQTLNHLGYNAAVDAYTDLKTELFRMIEEDKGKTDSKKILSYVNSHNEQIIRDIQDSLNSRMCQAQNDYEEAIEEARRRLIKDFEREPIHFEISLSSGAIELDDSFAKALKYNLNSFISDFLDVGSLALGGAGIGSLIAPGIGTVIGAFASSIVGVLNKIWKFFASESNRINEAKEKLQRKIDEQIDKVSDNIKNEMKKQDFEKKINASYDQIFNQAEKQKASLEFVKRLLNCISTDLRRNYEEVS